MALVPAGRQTRIFREWSSQSTRRLASAAQLEFSLQAAQFDRVVSAGCPSATRVHASVLRPLSGVGWTWHATGGLRCARPPA